MSSRRVYDRVYQIRERASAHLERDNDSVVELRADLDAITLWCDGLLEELHGGRGLRRVAARFRSDRLRPPGER